MPPSTDEPDELLRLNVDELVANLSDDERLCAAKELVDAAFRLCPKQSERDDMIAPQACGLATHLNAAVQSLLQTAAERQRAEYFNSIRERHEAVAAHGLH